MKKKRKVLVVILWQPQAGAAEKKILLLHLKPERGAYWQPVTGGVDEGESFAEGALREAEEETGLRFERQPQYLGLEYEFDGKWGPARERCFFLPVFGGKEPPTPMLDGKEHDGFEWVSTSEAAARVKHEGNRAAIERAANGAAPLFLSKRGVFMQDGEEVTHARTVELLHQALAREGEAVLVRVGQEELQVVPAGNVRFVQSIDRENGIMKLLGGYSEELRPETLRVEKDDSLSCELSSGWRATLLPPAYYELSKDITESSKAGEHRLHFRGRIYELAVAGKRERKNR